MLKGLLLAPALGRAGTVRAQAGRDGAEAWKPSMPVRLVVPFAPGGATDAVGRAFASRLEAIWGTPVVVDNRAGAGTTIGTAQVARAEPDGHTLLLAPVPLAIAHFLYANLPYDAVRDLAPVALLTRSPMMLVAGPRSGLKRFEDLRGARNLTCGTSGNGSLAHLLLELLKQRSGLEIVHVPYRGAGPAMAAIASGEVALTWGTPFELSAALQGGAIGLGQTGAARLPGLPEVPTFAEVGLPNVVGDAWFGIVAPGTTPPRIIDGIAAAAAAALASPEMQRALTSQGMPSDGAGPAAFATFLAAEMQRWGVVVRQAGLKLD
jgi:tripartite-type tricarboxylate transporter receptor subunit TctC